MTSKCTVNGPLAALPGMTAGAVCDNFQRDLALSLGDQRAPDDLAVTLTVLKRGAINAQFSRDDGDHKITYPIVSIDVVDRALQPEDLGRLARAAAHMLTSDGSSGLVSRAGIARGE